MAIGHEDAGAESRAGDLFANQRFADKEALPLVRNHRVLVDPMYVAAAGIFPGGRLGHIHPRTAMKVQAGWLLPERLMRAYLTEGRLVADPEALEELGAEAGLPRAEVAELLAGDRFAAEVREDERTASALGIHAVPFFVVDRALGASGAQPPEVLGEMLRQGWEARPKLAVVADGETCGVDGC